MCVHEIESLFLIAYLQVHRLASFSLRLFHPGGCEMKNTSLIARIGYCVCACSWISLVALPFNVVWCRKRLHDDALLKEEDRHVWPELSGSPCSLEHDSFHSDFHSASDFGSFESTLNKIILGCTNVHKHTSVYIARSEQWSKNDCHIIKSTV